MTKLEKHNVLQRCQMNTEPWPQITHVKNMVKFERVVFDLRLRNDKRRHVHGWIAVWIALHSSGTNAEKSSGRSANPGSPQRPPYANSFVEVNFFISIVDKKQILLCLNDKAKLRMDLNEARSSCITGS